jgi:hypothetical protein
MPYSQLRCASHQLGPSARWRYRRLEIARDYSQHLCRNGRDQFRYEQRHSVMLPLQASMSGA